mmetsp:Transcript_144437/g.366662  ORF Transcript_144437/g.366662 Transcript_144437/m.366662 type:complete len:93 (+) Transcript_144437:50-328(+)
MARPSSPTCWMQWETLADNDSGLFLKGIQSLRRCWSSDHNEALVICALACRSRTSCLVIRFCSLVTEEVLKGTLSHSKGQARNSDSSKRNFL